MEITSYLAAERRLLESLNSAAGNAGRAQALERLSEFYGFCGTNLRYFELNREPELSCEVLPFTDWDSFDAFFKSIPDSVGSDPLFEKAIARCSEAIELRQAMSDRRAEGTLWLRLAGLQDLSSEEFKPAEAFEKAAQIFEKLGDEKGLGEACMGQAFQARFRTYDIPRCQSLLEKAKAHFQRAGLTEGMAQAVVRLAETYDPEISDGKPAAIERCQALFNEAADLFEKAGNPIATVDCLSRLTNILRRSGRPVEEESTFARNLAFIEAHFTGKDLADNYAAASHFYEERGRKELADVYKKKAKALQK